MVYNGTSVFGYTRTHWSRICLPLGLSAAFGQTVTLGDRQDGLLAAGAIGAQDGNAERLRRHSRAAHTLLLHRCPLQGEHGLTATFALPGRQRGRDSEGQCQDTTELCGLIPEGNKRELIMCRCVCEGGSLVPRSSVILSGVLIGSRPL